MFTIALAIGSVVALGIFYASRYVKVGPNEVLIVSGRPNVYINPETGEKVRRNFSIYHGGGTFVLPVREKVDRMSVELITLEIRTPEFFTKYGVPIVVDAIAQIKVRSDDDIPIATAVEMFRSKSIREMNETAHQMMQGHLRGVISTMPFEEIHANPEAFAQAVQRLTAADLANMGIQVVSFTIREVQDPSGYLKALGRPQLAQVERDAVLGESLATRDSATGRGEAAREAKIRTAKAREEAELAEIQAEIAVAEGNQEKEVRLHELQARVSEAKASSDISYELNKAKLDQQVTEERLGINKVERERQIELEDLEIERKERELTHSVRRPADAERFRIETLANADQFLNLKQAEVSAESSRLHGKAEAEVIREKGKAEADAIRERAIAEAEGLKARCCAEAEGMRQRAQAWQDYNAAAVSQMVLDKLPEIAAAVSSPLNNVDRITLVNNGESSGTGIDKVTRGVTDVVAQLPGIIEMMTGVDLKDLISQVPGIGHSSMTETQNGAQDTKESPVDETEALSENHGPVAVSD